MVKKFIVLAKIGGMAEAYEVEASTIEEAKEILLRGEKPDVDEGNYFRVGGLRVWLVEK